MSNFLKTALEAYADGSTPTGTYHGMKAKLIELFKENTDKILQREIKLKELTLQSNSCRSDLRKNIDIREAITYVPLLSLAIHISINGEVIKDTRVWIKHLKKLNELTEIIGTRYYPAAINFVEEIADELTRADKYKITNGLGRAGLDVFIKNTGTDNFLGDWRLALEHDSVVFVADHLPVGTSYLKPLKKQECLHLLDVVDSLLLRMSKYGKQATNLNEALESVNRSINKNIKEEGELYLAITSPSDIIEKCEKEIKLTIKTILHCIEYSIRRMH